MKTNDFEVIFAIVNSGFAEDVMSVARELGVPVKYVGLGEGIDDMQRFDAAEYVKALI